MRAKTSCLTTWPRVYVPVSPGCTPVRLRTHDTGASPAFESVSGGSLVNRLRGCINEQCWFPWARRRVCTGCSRRTARSPTCCPCLASSHMSVFPDCQQIISMTASWLILHNRNYTEPLEGDHSGLLTPSDCPVTGNAASRRHSVQLYLPVSTENWSRRWDSNPRLYVYETYSLANWATPACAVCSELSVSIGYAC